MAAMQGALSASERSMRSVFVGNIPYEATEEQLKDIFCEIGPVVSFRLVYDRETGKPKGYGFCEYKDQEMALSAMRNLSGYELNGRPLRVDTAASEKSKEELKNLQASLGGPPVESPFGPPVPPEEAPEVISRVMASLPPEQLHEFMLQMKNYIEDHPNDARNLLVQNPQLSYALLQAQVLMKIISPETAASILRGPNGSPVRYVPHVSPSPMLPNSQVQEETPLSLNEVPALPSGSVQVSSNPSVNNPRTMSMPMPSRSSVLMPPPMAPPAVPIMRNTFSERGPRMANYDLRPQHYIDHAMGQTFADPRYQNPPAPDIKSHQGVSFNKPLTGVAPDRRTGYDARSVSGMSHRMEGPQIANIAPPDRRTGYDARSVSGMPHRMEGPQIPNFAPPDRRTGYDARNVSGLSHHMEDPRIANIAPRDRRTGYDTRSVSGISHQMEDGQIANNARASIITPLDLQYPRIGSTSAGLPIGRASPQYYPDPGNIRLAAAASGLSLHDQERAVLIRQVLQLTDQQVALLPPEQRECVMILREQVARNP